MMWREYPRILRIAGLAALTLSAGRLHAQVFEFNGGTSSQYEATGASVSLHAPGYDASIGAGMVSGHFSYGAKIQKMIGSSTLLTMGDDQIDILLPTDVFDASHYTYSRGLGLKTKIGDTDIAAFGGTTSTLYQTPIFQGGTSGPVMGFFGIHKTISPTTQVWSESLFSDKMTEIVAGQWTPARKLRFAASGGVGANDPYAAVSMNLSRKYVDVVGSYINAGPNFRRIMVSSPIQAEADKGNLLVTVKPTSFFTFSAGTQHFEVPDLNTNLVESSSVKEAATTLQLGGILFGGNFYESTALQQTSHAATVAASRDVTRWLKLASNYMVNKPQGSPGSGSVFTTITEVLNQHISVNENVSTADGQTTLYYGGSLLTNFLTVSANYETFYVPVNIAKPFQQSLMLDVSLHLFGRATLHGGTFVGPTGKTLYTATANAIAVRGTAEQVSGEQISMGDSLLRVQVIDSENRPVEGAALLLDQKPVFTGSDGVFEMRERKRQAHALKVLTDQFLDGGTWEVQSTPSQVWSGVREGDPGAVVIVRRVPVLATTVKSSSSSDQNAGSLR